MKHKILRISKGFVVLIGWWFGSAFAEELKIACVDIQRAVNECGQGGQKLDDRRER